MKTLRFQLFWLLYLLFMVAALVAKLAHGQQPILTKSYDNARTSANMSETILTPAALKAQGMTKLPNIPVIGDARGMEAQPLVDVIGIGATPQPPFIYSVMILPSEANIIRGVDPATGTGIWQTLQLCVPIKAVPANDMWGTNDHFGMMSTGVIDADTHKLYQVAFCSADGSGNYPTGVVQRMFVLDTRTGAVLANTLLTGQSNGFNYQDAPRKQRAALLFWQLNGVKFVMVMAGSFAETGANATGWLLAFDTFDNQFKAALSTHAGGWMSGQGPAEDPATGLIYLGLGNGPYNAKTAFGEATLQIEFVPPTATTAATLAVAHPWALFLDTLRTSSTAPTPAITGTANMPGMAMGSTPALLTGPAWGDQDAVLSGTLLLDYNLYVTAGKDGIAAVIDTTKFPDTAVLDFADPKANCAKVRLYWAGWNQNADPCPTDQRALNLGGKTRHQHSPIVQYKSDKGNTYLLFFAENSPLQAWRVNANGTLSYVGLGTEYASAGVANGMPGGFCSASSNKGADAIAWCSIVVGDANRTMTTGFLAAYDLTVLDNMAPGGTIPTIWKSDTYSFSKFSQPIVFNGQAYLPDSAGSLMRFGLEARNGK